MLIDGRKFDYRVKMIIANMDPQLVLYHDGSWRIASEQYLESSIDLNAHVTNPGVNIEREKRDNSDK